MSAESRSFQIQTHADGARRTLVLSGELDMLVAPELEDAVRRLCDGGAGELTLFELTGLADRLPFQTNGQAAAATRAGILPRLFVPAEHPEDTPA
jgi:hypothetical protein